MTEAAISLRSAVPGLIRRCHDMMERIPYSMMAVVARLSMAGVFWRSGQTKVEGFALSPSAIELFRNEYQLPLLDPVLAAYLAAFAEHMFPALLVVGLATRFAALALLVMTLVIQIFVYPDAWPVHGTWAACFLLLMARGAGILSLDHVLQRMYAARG